MDDDDEKVYNLNTYISPRSRGIKLNITKDSKKESILEDFCPKDNQDNLSEELKSFIENKDKKAVLQFFKGISNN